MSLGMGGLDPGALQKMGLEAIEQAGQKPAVPEMPREGDIAQFQTAMNSGGGAGTIAGPNADVTPASPGVSAGTLSMGDRIINGMSSISEKVQLARNDAAAVLDNPDPTQADLLRANFAMMESSTLVTAVSKTTEKITQGVKTLQQG